MKRSQTHIQDIKNYIAHMCGGLCQDVLAKPHAVMEVGFFKGKIQQFMICSLSNA